MSTRRIVACAVLSGLVLLPFGCGKQETGQVRDKQEKVAIEGAKAKPKQEAVAADKLQNRAGVIFIVNGEKPFSGMAQDFYGNGQMKWEAGITDGKVLALKRWHQNGVLELQCGFTGGTLDIIQIEAQELLREHSAILDGEYSAFYDNGQKYLTAKFNRGQPSGDLAGWYSNGNPWIKASFVNGALTQLENYNDSGQIEGKAGFSGADFIATFYRLSVLFNVSMKELQVKELHGEFVLYHPNGQMAAQRTYDNGSLVGETREWAATGGELKLVPLAGMIHVEPGMFTMGSPDTESQRERDEVQHAVTITKEYWLGKYEVTQGEWETVMGSNPSNFKGNNRLPVENVSWNDAMAFCQKVTERERNAGRLTEGYVYKLPTEAQWEYACRAGSTAAYAGDLGAMAWYSSNSGNETHPVGAKQANAWGFHDMHGNVWEWCSDWYDDYPAGSATDPTGPLRGWHRVLRGGSWLGSSWDCRSARRFPDGPGYRNYSTVGFRLCLAPVR
jgi:formylglycine-generating enzyme required for sulfatase activity